MDIHTHTLTCARTHTVHLSTFILIFISGQTSLQYSDILSNYIVVFGTNKHMYRFISSDYNLTEMIGQKLKLVSQALSCPLP